MRDSAFENFSEDAQNVLDFARCQRPDGSFYGTSGQCRKGSPTGAKEKAAAKSKAAKDSKKEEANRARSQKQKQNSERAKAFKQELDKRKDEMKGASPEKINKLIAEAAKAADKTEQLRQINTQEGRGGGAGKPVSKAKSSEAQAAGKEARKEMIAARDKEKQLKEARQKADRKVADAKSDLSSAKSDLARKDLTSSERAQATTMKGQAERDLKKQNEAAATARRAHIDSKNEMKAAAQRFRDRQTANNDMRRFGRQEERDKASIKQLQEALKSGKLSPTKERSVKMDISRRQARNKVRKDIKKLG